MWCEEYAQRMKMRISFLIVMLASYIKLWLHIKTMTGYYFSRIDFYFLGELTY